MAVSVPSSGLDANPLEPAGGAALDRHRCLGAAELPRHQRDQLLVGLAFHRGSLQLRQPAAVFRLRQQAGARVRPDLASGVIVPT